MCIFKTVSVGSLFLKCLFLSFSHRNWDQFSFLSAPLHHQKSIYLPVIWKVLIWRAPQLTSHQAWGLISFPPLAQAALTSPPPLLSNFSNSFTNYSSITCNSDRCGIGVREQQCTCSVLALKDFVLKGKKLPTGDSPSLNLVHRVTLTWRSKFLDSRSLTRHAH